MTTTSSNNKQLAKNTIILYIRTLFVLFLSFYSSRLILQNLGVDDYGLYNVVGGVVSIFSIFSGCLTTATSRYLTYEIGKGNGKEGKVFSASMHIHLFLGVILLIILETIGVWFLNYKMNIPGPRMYAANIVLQVSIISFFINVTSIPYNSLIIAYEKMVSFAYISLLESILKVIAAASLVIFLQDKLIIYSILIFLNSLLIRLIYLIYCRTKLKTRFVKIKDKGLYRELLGFASYNMIGAASQVCSNQGLNILINIIWGVSLNAARGISAQLETGIVLFMNSFMTAINPQIIKSYASQNFQRTIDLVVRGSMFSYLMMLIIAMPLLICTKEFLDFWLNSYPNYTIDFVRLAIINTLIFSLSNTTITAIQATGKIRLYQIIIGGLQLSVLPLAYFITKEIKEPQIIYFVLICITIICLFLRYFLLGRIMQMKIMNKLVKMLAKIALISLLSYYITNITINTESIHGILKFILSFCVNIISLILFSYIIIFDNDEKLFLNKYVSKKFHS